MSSRISPKAFLASGGAASDICKSFLYGHDEDTSYRLRSRYPAFFTFSVPTSPENSLLLSISFHPCIKFVDEFLTSHRACMNILCKPDLERCTRPVKTLVSRVPRFIDLEFRHCPSICFLTGAIKIRLSRTGNTDLFNVAFHKPFRSFGTLPLLCHLVRLPGRRLQKSIKFRLYCLA